MLRNKFYNTIYILITLCIASSFPVAAASAVVYCATVMTLNILSLTGSVSSLFSTTTCYTTCSPLSPPSPQAPIFIS
ncbi:hypothetical protein EB796_006864 [Bugula neritina]|uniref:Secreted protein n=1 Tax=Bugula neritina TaxID=10212 RepID=A0A7J7K9B5_BUGNE|nr:hypothetical protein EB796_006864 [Bugula neritina]